jgi:hypothetical protein
LPGPIVQAVAYHLPSCQNDATLSPLAAIHIANAYYNGMVESDGSEPNRNLDRRFIDTLGFTDKIDGWFIICRSTTSRSG